MSQSHNPLESTIENADKILAIYRDTRQHIRQQSLHEISQAVIENTPLSDYNFKIWLQMASKTPEDQKTIADFFAEIEKKKTLSDGECILLGIYYLTQYKSVYDNTPSYDRDNIDNTFLDKAYEYFKQLVEKIKNNEDSYADNADVRALYYYGDQLFTGMSGKDYIIQAAKEGHLGAIAKLRGDALKENSSLILDILQQDNIPTDPNLLRTIGHIYYHGSKPLTITPDLNLNKALICYQASSKLGNTATCFDMADYYAHLCTKQITLKEYRKHSHEAILCIRQATQDCPDMFSSQSIFGYLSLLLNYKDPTPEVIFAAAILSYDSQQSYFPAYPGAQRSSAAIEDTAKKAFIQLVTNSLEKPNPEFDKELMQTHWDSIAVLLPADLANKLNQYKFRLVTDYVTQCTEGKIPRNAEIDKFLCQSDWQTIAPSFDPAMAETVHQHKLKTLVSYAKSHTIRQLHLPNVLGTEIFNFLPTAHLNEQERKEIWRMLNPQAKAPANLGIFPPVATPQEEQKSTVVPQTPSSPKSPK